MKKAIVMKCNQEQWDAIKGKLVGCRISDIEIFEQDYYLINNYASVRNSITNFWENEAKGNNRIVYETWNEKVFLEACGIETEKIFKGSELQYWNEKLNNWMNCQHLEYRLKPDYSKEIAQLKEQIKKLENE